MSDDLEAAVFGEHETLSDGLDCVATVSVPGDVFEDRLNADFKPGASII